MGDAGVAIADDVWATHWNPAGYGFQKGSKAGLDYTAWQPVLNQGDVWILSAVYAQSIKKLEGTIYGAFTYLNQGEIARTGNDGTVLGTFRSYELAIAAGYARKLSDVLGIGFAVRLIRSVLAPFGTAEGTGSGSATGFSCDVGMLYTPTSLEERLRLGFNVSNIGPKMTYMDKSLADPLPMNLRLGLAFKALKAKDHNITLALDFNKMLVKREEDGSDEFYEAFFTSWTGTTLGEQIGSFTAGIGIEYWYGSPGLVALRTGYFYEDPRYGNRQYYSFGVGVRVDSYGCDFSYIAASEKDHPLGGTLRFSLLASWGASRTR